MDAVEVIYYRMVQAGIDLVADGERLTVTSEQPFTDAVRDHKGVLLDLAAWYEDDAMILQGLAEQQFLVLVQADLDTRMQRY